MIMYFHLNDCDPLKIIDTSLNKCFKTPFVMTDTQPAFQVVSKGGLKIRSRLLLRKIRLYTRYALRSISSTYVFVSISIDNN